MKSSLVGGRSGAALSLRANVSWTFVGNVLYAACQWGMVTLLVKLGDPETVGRLTLALALSAPIFMLSNLNLRSLQATETTGALDFQDFLGVRLVMTALAVGATILLAAVGGYTGEVALVVGLLGISRGVDALSDVIHGKLQRDERMDLLSGSLMLRGLISVGALTAVYAATRSLPWSVAALAGGNLLVLVTFDLRNLLHTARAEDSPLLHPRWERARTKKILADALPLGAVMMLISLNANVPRYFIESSLGAYTLGIFAPLAQLIAAGYLVVNALGQSATPRLAKLHASGDRQRFRRLLLTMLATAIVLCLLGLLLSEVAGRQVLTLLYSVEYAAHVDLLYLFVILAGLQFVGSFLGYAMTAARRYRIQLPLFVATTIVCTAASWLLIPTYGLRGAIWALMASALVQLLGSALIVAAALRPASSAAPPGGRTEVAMAKR